MSAPRAVWKGSIQFGLVHVPVALYAAADEQPVDFDWLDKRSMEPVGYQRINKSTGLRIEPDNVVKGIAVAPNQYVVITEAEIAASTPKSRKTVAIESFVSNREIPFVYLGRAYYMVPINQGLKVYALLHGTLLEAERVGLARLVMHGKQHLAAVVPAEGGLMLNLLRWPADIRPWTDLDMPTFDTSVAGVSSRERAMARQLVDGMTHLWQPSQYGRDPFKERIQALVQHKVHLGLVQSVPALSLGTTDASAELPFDAQGNSQSTPEVSNNQAKPDLQSRVQQNMLDLTDLLLRSLQGSAIVKAPLKRNQKISVTLAKKPDGLILSKPANTSKKGKSHVPKPALL